MVWTGRVVWRHKGTYIHSQFFYFIFKGGLATLYIKFYIKNYQGQDKLWRDFLSLVEHMSHDQHNCTCIHESRNVIDKFSSNDTITLRDWYPSNVMLIIVAWWRWCASITTFNICVKVIFTIQITFGVNRVLQHMLDPAQLACMVSK